MSGLTLMAIVEALLQLSMILMIGLYFVFSNTIMRVLSQRQDGAGVMIDINQQILNPIFLAGFGISGLAGLYLFFYQSGVLAFAGSVFFVGTTLVTMFFNVPLNNKLQDAAPDCQPIVWQSYLKRWVFWNHIRTGCALCSGFLLVLA